MKPRPCLPRRLRAPVLAALPAAALPLILLAGCGSAGAPTESAEPSATAAQVAARATASPVRRLPTATPTPDPAAPVPSEAIPGIVVPAGAVLVGRVPAGAENDARADYRVDGIDPETLGAWFVAELPAAGWGEAEDRDGVLVFLHGTELSERYAGIGQKRTATLILAPDEGIDFTLLVEAPQR